MLGDLLQTILVFLGGAWIVKSAINKLANWLDARDAAKEAFLERIDKIEERLDEIEETIAL